MGDVLEIEWRVRCPLRRERRVGSFALRFEAPPPCRPQLPRYSVHYPARPAFQRYAVFRMTRFTRRDHRLWTDVVALDARMPDPARPRGARRRSCLKRTSRA